MIESCKGCGYDFDVNPLELSVVIDARACAGDRLNLYCPVCGAEYLEGATLSKLGARRRANGSVVAWRSRSHPALRIEGATLVDLDDVLFDAVPVFSDGQGEAQTGPLPVRPELIELVDLETFRAHPEWHGRIDESSGRYIVEIPFWGLDGEGSAKPRRFELPLIGSQGRLTAQPRRDAIQNLELTIWPKVRADLWKTFIIEARATGADRTWLTGREAGRLEVRFLPAEKGAGGARGPDDSGLCHLEEAGFCGFSEFQAASGVTGERLEPLLNRRVAMATGGRPRLVCLSGKGAGGEEWGVLFLPLTPYRSTRSDQSFSMALDFGTSNSCLAFSNALENGGRAVNNGILPIIDTYETLLCSRPEAANLKAEEYAPRFPSRGFGPRREFLPSELVTRWPARLLMSSNATSTAGTNSSSVGSASTAMSPTSWRPGIDMAILGDDLDWTGLDPGDVTLSNLKWADPALGHVTAGAARREFLTAYLSTLLLHQLALLCCWLEKRDASEAVYPLGALMHFGYPGSWTAETINLLKGVLGDAVARPDPTNPTSLSWGVMAFLDLRLEVGEAVNEAFAAARVTLGDYLQETPSRGLYSGKLLVDIGGGSTDITFVWEPTSVTSGLPQIVEYMTSLRYAGEDLFQALLGPSAGADLANRCLAPGHSPSQISRSLRKIGPSLDILDPHKRSMAQRRIRAFFQQLVEVLARIVASTFFNGQYQRRDPQLNPLKVSFVRLGNGWGLGAIAYPTMDSTFAADLESRVIDLLGRGGLGSSSVRIESMRIPEHVHPKHAVAAGLLQKDQGTSSIRYASSRRAATSASDLAQGSRSGSSTDWVFRTITGVPTRILPLGHEDQGLPMFIGWWLPVESDARYYELVHGTRLVREVNYSWTFDDFREAKCEFPPTAMVDQESFRLALSRSRSLLQERCLSSIDFGWFSSSPLELLMVSGLRERLEELA